jgi:putative glycosyltransferase
MSAMDLSIVTTLYRSAATIEEFCARMVAAARQFTEAFEIIIVDDGSPDDSLSIATRLACAEPRIKVIELARNFGHHKALMTGLDHATGARVFMIDSDLDEDPALLRTFDAEMARTDCDVVYGFQERRAGSLGRRISGDIAFAVINTLVKPPIPDNHLTVRLMRAEYVAALRQHRERQTIMGGLWVITGFRQIGLPVTRTPRTKSSYSLWRRWTMLIDSVTSFSDIPLVAVFYLGMAIMALTLAVGAWVITTRMIVGRALEGWVSVMLSVWFLGGLAVFCIGLVGIYVSRIFIETKQRPYTIIRRIHQAGSAPP